MRNFFTAFYNSLYNASWIKAARFYTGRAWGYFALLVLAFALLTAIPAAVAFRAGVREVNKIFGEKVPDFTAKFEKGKLAVSNLTQPYVFQNSEFAIAVDTRATTTESVEKLVQNTVNNVVITSELIEARETDGSTRIQNWSAVPDFSFTKTDITNFVGKFLAAPGVNVLAVIVIFVALFIAFFVGKLYTILMVTIITYIVAKIAGRQWKWGETFTMGLYAITLPTIIGIVFTLIGLQVTYISFVALLAFMLAMVFSDEEKKIEDEN